MVWVYFKCQKDRVWTSGFNNLAWVKINMPTKRVHNSRWHVIECTCALLSHLHIYAEKHENRKKVSDRGLSLSNFVWRWKIAVWRKFVLSLCICLIAVKLILKLLRLRRCLSRFCWHVCQRTLPRNCGILASLINNRDCKLFGSSMHCHTVSNFPKIWQINIFGWKHGTAAYFASKRRTLIHKIWSLLLTKTFFFLCVFNATCRRTLKSIHDMYVSDNSPTF